MRTLFIIAVRNLMEHRRRTLMLGGGIAFVTMILVILVSLSSGMRESLMHTATTLSTGHVNVGGFYKVTPSSSSPLVTDVKGINETIAEEVDGVELLVNRMRGYGKFISEEGSITAGIAGIDIAGEPRLKDVLEIVEGDLENLAEPDTLLLFAAQAERLNVGVGDQVTIAAPTMRGVNNTADVRVVAIARDLGLLSAFTVLVPAATDRKLYQVSDDTTGVVMIYLDDRARAPIVAAQLRTALRAAGHVVMEPEPVAFWLKFQQVNREDWTGQRLDVTTWEDEVSGLVTMISAFEFIANALMLILIIIIVVGVMNTIWMAIRERTGEIGTLRAIGMPKGQVMLMFLFEAAVLSVVASVIGVGLGAVFGAVVNTAEIGIPDPAVRIFLMRDTLYLHLDLANILQAVLVISSLVTLGALLPAWRAARLPPLTAIHNAG